MKLVWAQANCILLIHVAVSSVAIPRFLAGKLEEEKEELNVKIKPIIDDTIHQREICVWDCTQHEMITSVMAFYEHIAVD